MRVNFGTGGRRTGPGSRTAGPSGVAAQLTRVGGRPTTGRGAGPPRPGGAGTTGLGGAAGARLCNTICRTGSDGKTTSVKPSGSGAGGGTGGAVRAAAPALMTPLSRGVSGGSCKSKFTVSASSTRNGDRPPDALDRPPCDQPVAPKSDPSDACWPRPAVGPAGRVPPVRGVGRSAGERVAASGTASYSADTSRPRSVGRSSGDFRNRCSTRCDRPSGTRGFRAATGRASSVWWAIILSTALPSGNG